MAIGMLPAVVVVEVGGGGGGSTDALAARAACNAHFSTIPRILLSFNIVLLAMGRPFKTDSICQEENTS